MVNQNDLIYSGSVKDVLRDPSGLTDRVVFRFSDRYSVFDWGEMPDQIPEKGKNLCDLAEFFFEKAHEAGIRSHFISRKSPSEILVQKFSDQGEQTKDGINRRFIPLECIFRFVLVPESSVLTRRKDLHPGELATPMVEFFTKREDFDRILDRGEAKKIANLTDADLTVLERETLKLARILKEIFSKSKIELIDGKFEWGIETAPGKPAQFVLVDSIGPDELRLKYRGVELSKESVRHWYRGTLWQTAWEIYKSDVNTPSAEFALKPEKLPAAIVHQFSGQYQGLFDALKSQTTDPLEKWLNTHRLQPKRNVLILGSGGREHALCATLLRSRAVHRIFIAPGSTVMVEKLKIDFPEKQIICWSQHMAKDPVDWIKLAEKESVDLVVIGPDQLLAEGVADLFRAKGFDVFGPGKAGAQLEWSKSFSKEILHASKVPTAGSVTLTGPDAVAKHLESISQFPLVLKADGLALGKGVSIVANLAEAKVEADRLLRLHTTLIIEEFLEGEELSAFALLDGVECRFFGFARDYKRLLDGQNGPNTGGMGAISPVAGFDVSWQERLIKECFTPVLAELRKRDISFQGVLYAGLMVHKGNFKVLEFNVRFGDPETQALLPRLKDDIYPWFKAVATQNLSSLPKEPEFFDECTAYVVAAAKGYPENPVKGDQISGIEISKFHGFFSGVDLQENLFKTAGGRVLGTLGIGKNPAEASKRAYEELAKVSFDGLQFRKDIER